MKTLCQEIANKQRALAYAKQRAREPGSDPRDAHDAELSAKRLAAEIATHKEHLAGNREAIEMIESVVRYLEGSPLSSAHRVLAMRELENASMRLQRESGTE